MSLSEAIAVVRAHGGTVQLPQSGPWIAPLELWRNSVAPYDVGSARFRDRLHHPKCPPFERRLGPSGRLCALRPTEALLSWLRKPGQAGRAL